MSLDYIQVYTANLFNKQIVFMFNMLTHLTRLAYKVISFCYYCLICGCNCI